jgi:DNA repair protein RadA/Sms
MAKVQTKFVCNSCGAVHTRWMGKCPDCGTWDALGEFRVDSGAAKDSHRGAAAAAVVAGDAAPKAVPIAEIGDGSHDGTGIRLATGLAEFDRVLGGVLGKTGKSAGADIGLVPGSTVLVGGDPGIGKSTLLLQAAHAWATRGHRVLYVSSEESANQLRLRAGRLGAADGNTQDLYVLADTNLARLTEQARQVAPDVMVVDSIQMIYKGDLPAAPGSVTQLRACCQELVYFAKATGCAVVFVGHVRSRQRDPTPRVLPGVGLLREGDRLRGGLRRARHQGRPARRPASAGAHG